MSYATLNPQKTAILFFEMLNQYMYKRPTPERERISADIIANCVKLRRAAKETGALIFHAQDDERPDLKDYGLVWCDTDHRLNPWEDPEAQLAIAEAARGLAVPGTWGVQIIDELAPDEDDYVIVKKRWSAFFQTPLELSLRTRGVDTIVLCGGLISSGGAATAFAAHDLDFNLVIAKDCCTWHVEGELDFFMTEVFPRMGRVRTADKVIAMLRSA